MAQQLLFEANEKILCFHGPLLYEAKVLKGELWTGKANPEENGPHYFIHYKGWKDSWDEWVPESRTLKYNDENLKRQAELNESFTAKKSKSSGKKSATTQESSSGTGINKKRARDLGEREEEFLKRPEIKISISERLKIQLVDDWENITKDLKLVTLPRTPNVAQILSSFRERGLKKLNGKDSAQEDVLNEVVEGLKCYFDKALGSLLLYRFERHQYVELRKRFPEKEPSEIYGAEHLLRLFVQLPQLIAHTNMEPDTIKILKDQFAEFLKYIEYEAEKLFHAREYDNASPMYLKLAEST